MSQQENDKALHRVTATVKARDVIVGQFAMAFSFSVNLWMIGALAVFLFATSVQERGWVGAAIFAPVVALFAFIVFYAVGMLFQIPLLLDKRSGFLGEKVFEIRERGMFARSTPGELLAYWHAVGSARKSRHSIYVKVASWQFHVIPRRAFADQQAYDNFFQALSERMSAGKE